MIHNRSDYDFDVISGPSTPPPARPSVFRPPEPRRQPPATATTPPVRAEETTGAVEEV